MMPPRPTPGLLAALLTTLVATSPAGAALLPEALGPVPAGLPAAGPDQPASCASAAPTADLTCALTETITLFQDTLNATLATAVLGTISPVASNQAGPDRDNDGRSDYYYVRAVQGGATFCSLLQSDFVWDGPTPAGSGPTYAPVPQTGALAPDLAGTSNTSATFMVYPPRPGANAADCPAAAPQVEPLARVGGHLRGHLRGATGVFGASEGDPTRLVLWVNDTEQYRVEIFQRPFGQRNAGTHVVLRSFNPSRLDANASQLGGNTHGFMTPIDLTNLHILSGGSDLSDLTAPVVSPFAVTRHDWDDDGFNDVAELTTPTPPNNNVGDGVSTRLVNPLNACSTPADYDGDGMPNAVDGAPTVADRFDCAFGWIFAVTGPAAGSTQSKDVTITWTAQKVDAADPDLDHFRLVLLDNANPPNQKLVFDNIPSANRSHPWFSHATRFTDDVRDGDYRIRLEAFDLENRVRRTAGGVFSLKNFDYTVTVTEPAAGATRNGTFWANWTLAANRADQLPIDHLELKVEKAADAGQTRVIDDDLPAETRSFLWDSVAATVADLVFFTDGDYRFRVTAFDSGGAAGQKDDDLGDAFTLRNRPVPVVNGLAIADANGIADAPGNVTGAIDFAFNVSGGRADAATRTFSLELFRCSGPGGDGQLITPVPLTGTATRGRNVVTIPAEILRGNLTGLYPCNTEGGVSGTMQNNANLPLPVSLNELTRGTPQVNPSPFANDGLFRVKVVATERHEGISASGDARTDGRAFHNRLPTVEDLAAAALDQAQVPDDVPVLNQVRFTANVTDPDGRCLGRPIEPLPVDPAGEPRRVQLRVHHATTGALLRTANMQRANVPGVLSGGLQGFDAEWQLRQHALQCPRSVPPTNANLSAGVLYEALLDLPPGAYVYNVTVLDFHGNAQDGDAALGHGRDVVSANAPALVAPFGLTSVSAVQTLLDTAWSAVENNGVVNCDLNDDGTPAPECEDVLPAATGAANANAPALLPNVWGIASFCANGLNPSPFCPGDRDLDGDPDDLENATGTDWLNPFENRLDPDADLILNRTGLPGNPPVGPGPEGLAVDVHLYHIDWVRAANPAEACRAEDNHANPVTGCVGKIRVLASGKSVTVRDPQALGNPNAWLVKVEESPGNVAKASTTQAGGLSWTLVDGVVGVDPTGGRIRAYVNASDGQRVADVALDLTKIGVPGEAFLSVDLLGGANSFGADVHSNPVNVVQSGTVSTPAGVLDTEVDLNRTVRFVAPGSSAPASCSAAGGAGTWLRADRNANNSWTVCASVSGARQGPVTTPVNFFPTGGVFFGNDGVPVLWLDKNGDRTYQDRERLNPNPLDLDGDRYDNLAEVQAGSNPLYSGSYPGHIGAGFPLDWDADGSPNTKELQQGSNPLQACSTPSNPNGWPADPDCEAALPV